MWFFAHILKRWDTDSIALISICFYVSIFFRKAIESVFRVNSGLIIEKNRKILDFCVMQLQILLIHKGTKAQRHKGTKAQRVLKKKKKISFIN